MRPTTHRTPLALAALTLLLAGCGTQAGGDGGDGDAVSPSPSSPPSACASPGELGAADNGSTVCVAVGGTVRVSLDGTKSRPWEPVTSGGRGLKATNSGVVLLPGDASAAFEAVSAGRARLSSSRPVCSKEPGVISCDALQEWGVTVVVR
ncbi:hypothetical protein SLINC_5617 [Streptomyces lincolnensis]|uniref:Uncharacterized protein n=1 Tax=Streptomyces lincolnensis TaxID=1915 RepID=A0A1B1MGY3_STRLN|nr:hypothetical protein [Streptomyces lincolnensis]ANS67841.1 hypothetical protein SLINC_5617 [Streptomyces lincolnensis]AXG53953.1 hypothetical protein SLCG_2798 [Streptomyces lincolnensis]QMV09500.1 hypothetical protein GJU35_30170 [Streptomyces lincolnensis]